MSEIDPTELERGQLLMVSDSDSRYDGTVGRIVQIYDHRMILELDVSTDGRALVGSFDLDQLVLH